MLRWHFIDILANLLFFFYRKHTWLKLMLRWHLILVYILFLVLPQTRIIKWNCCADISLKLMMIKRKWLRLFFKLRSDNIFDLFSPQAFAIYANITCFNSITHYWMKRCILSYTQASVVVWIIIVLRPFRFTHPVRI